MTSRNTNKISKVELEPTDDEVSDTSTESRARGLLHAAEALPTLQEAAVPDSPTSSVSIHEPVCDGKTFPPKGLSQYDNDTLSCGLFAQYTRFLDDAADVFQETNASSRSCPMKALRLDSNKFFRGLWIN